MRTLQTMYGRALSLAIVFSLLAVNIFSQQQTSSLRGQVMDENGAVVVGATVAVTGAGGAQRNVNTDEKGQYAVNSLQPGTYTVQATGDGFAPSLNEVQLTAGAGNTLDIKLGIQLQEEVAVDGSGSGLNTDPENNASALVLRGADLDVLSDDPDQLAADLAAMAGGADGPNGARFYVDGFSGAKLPPKTSIREVRINANPFSAEQDFLGFRRVDILTTPGTDKFRGQAFYNFNDESLNARHPFSPDRAPFQARLFGGSFGGPLYKKRASFFVDFERRDIAENAVVNALVLDAAGNPTRFNETVLVPQTRTNLSARVDYQLNPNHTLVARFQHGRSGEENGGVGNLSLPSRAFNTSTTDSTLQLTETAVLGPTMLNETRFQFTRSDRSQLGDNSVATINVRDAFTGGGSQVGLSSYVVNRYELNNVTTRVSGSHTLKFGGRLRHVSIADDSTQNPAGTFVFTSLEQYRQVLAGVPGARPAQFQLVGGNTAVGASKTDIGLFVQDDWRLHPTFTLSAGLRYEAQTNLGDRMNFGPRASFAWAPGAAKAKQPKTVIRGGGGIFFFNYDEDLTFYANRFDGINRQQYIIDNPGFFTGAPTAEQLAANAVPQSIWRAADNLKMPYSIKGAISIEQQLPYKTTLSAVYIYERDLHAIRARNINAPLPGTFDINLPGSGVRPLGGLANVYVFEDSSRNTDNTVFINVNSRFHPKFSAFGLIGLSRETGDADGPFSFPADSYDLSPEYSAVLDDVRAFANLGLNYNGPWGLTFNSLIRVSSPGRFNIVTGRDTNGDSVFTERPAFATDLTRPSVVVTPYGAFDLDPQPGQEIIPRNYGRGNNLFQVNLRVGKTFQFGKAEAKSERKPYSLTFSAQVQNIFNRTNLGPIVGNLSSARFGQSTTAATGPRRIDMQVRFNF
ncbi:MAG: TonB-dependent receptor [Acidobacteriota bacterium]|nr:TonB-dependent receptor [Acidobacteriota bacterium]